MLFRILTALFFSLGALTIFSLGARNPAGIFISSFIGGIPFGDKSLHFTLLAAFSFLLNGSLGNRRINISGKKILLGSLLAAAVMTLEECSQAFIPSRNFDVRDMLCNYAGIFAGSVLCILIPHGVSKPL